MNSTEEVYGSLLFFRKDGQLSTRCQISSRKTTIGSSKDADIRFMNNKRLEEVHCIIEVNDLGIATLFNKSVSEPVKINNICIRKSKILQNDDEVVLAGKKFIYLNEHSPREHSGKRTKSVKKTGFTPSKKRHSSTHVDLKSGKKSPSFKTKIPIQMRPSTRRYSSTSSDFTVTHEERPDKGKILDRSKSTSKVVVSKAMGSPRSSKKRRLSFGDKPKKVNSPKMSTRNILLNRNIISTITEEEKVTSPKLSASMTKLDKSDKQNDEGNQRLYSDDLSSEELIELNLSSNPSLSSITSSPGETNAPSSKKSLSRKSLAKRCLQEGRISKSPRKSLLRHCLQKNQDTYLTKSKESLQESETGNFNDQYSTEEFPVSNKSSRRSSRRKSKIIEKRGEEQLEEQFLSDKSEGESDTLLSARQSNTDETTNEPYKTQFSNEQSLILSESHTPNKYLRKSRSSLNSSKTVDSPKSRSLRKSRAVDSNEQFSTKESPISGKPRDSLKKSKTKVKREEEVLDEQFLSEGSEKESDSLLSVRKSTTNRKIDEQYETQSSSEAFLESRTPNVSLRESTQILNKSKIVESPYSRGSLRKSKTGDFHEQLSTKESPISNKFSGHSSRKSKAEKNGEGEQLEEQFLSEESESESDMIFSERKSRIDRNIDEQYETQSSSEESLLLPQSRNISLRKSTQSLNKSKIVESLYLRGSLRKSKIGDYNDQFSSKEVPISSKSFRHSSRKSKTTEKREEGQLERQFLGEESEENILLSRRKSITDRNMDEQYETQSSSEESLPESHTPNIYLRNSRNSSFMFRSGGEFDTIHSKSKTHRNIDQQYETQSSNEESLALPESGTANVSSRKSTQSLNRNKRGEERSVQKSKTGEFKEQYSSKESHSPNNSFRHSLRKSKTTEKSGGKQLEEQFLNEESMDTLVSKRQSKTDRNIEKQYETQSSCEESLALPESRTPNKYLRKSRHSLNKSKTVESPNESVTRSTTRKNQTIENGKEKQNKESSGTSGILADIKKSRKSLKTADTLEESKRNESPIVDVFKSPSPSKSSLRARQSLMRRNMGKPEKYNELLSESEDISEMITLASPTQRTSLKSNSVMDEDECDQYPLRRLSISLAQLQTPNSEAAKESCFSLRKSYTADGDQARESFFNTSVTTLEKRGSSSVRKSNRSSRSEKLLELQSMEEPTQNVSVMSTPKEMSVQRRSTAFKKLSTSVRKTNELNEDDGIENLSSSEESLFLNISPMNAKQMVVQEPTTPRTMRGSSVRKSNRLSERNADEDLSSSSEEFFVLNISPMNDTKETNTARKTVGSLKKRESSVRKSNKLNKEEETEAQSLTEESPDLNISVFNSLREISKQTPSTTPKEMRTSLRKSRASSIRNSNRLNEDEEVRELPSSEESLGTCGSTNSTPKEKSLLRRATETPKETCSVKEAKGRKSNMSDQDEEFGGQSSSEESFVLNISAGNSPKEVSIQRFSATTKESVTSEESPKERRSSARKSHRLNISERSDEICSLVSIRMSTERRSSVRKSSKLNQDLDVEGMSSSEVFLGSNVSEINASTMTPKQMSLVRTSKERGSSVRKNSKLNKGEESLTLCSSEEFFSPNLSTENRRSSMRRNNKSVRDEDLLVSNVSAMGTPKETSVQSDLSTTPNESISSVRKSNILNRTEEIDDISSNDESLDLNDSSVDSPKDTSIRKRSTTKSQRGSSVGKNTRDEKTIELSSSDGSCISFLSGSIEETIEKHPSATKRSIRMSESRYSNRNSSVFYVSNSKNSTPIPASHRNDTNEALKHFVYSNQDESVGSPQDRITPKLRHSSVKKNHLNTEEETSDLETSSTKSKARSSKSVSASKLNKAALTRSKQNISVITLNDSVELTPENNTSVIIINASLEDTKKSNRKRLSKTLNSTIQDDVELTTPKSAIKSRRSKSLPYNPLVEEITPVTPLSKSKNESGFKTPLNTPGLFEDIKKSVLRSRSQMQKLGTNLMEELSKSEPKRGIKRPLVEGSCGESSKRRKVEIQMSDTFDTSHEANSRSFESFSTDDVLTDISDANVTQNTPKHFSDLTDKPVITHPQIRSSIEPKGRKSKSGRKSLHSVQLSSQGSTDSSAKDETFVFQTSSSDQNDSVFETSTTSDLSSRSLRRSSLRNQTTEESDSPMMVRQKTPKNDFSDVAGLKKLLKTPREIKSPKNDLTKVPNLRKFMSPKTNNSPRNDLTNIVGVKKLLATPKQIKSPKNDLRKIPNLRKLMSPKQENSPKNDLSDVAGVKKLLSTPNKIKSPRNDLRNVPNLRRLMSPSTQNSPKNDLSDVGGVKKLLATPKYQKSPKNDLTNVPNLRRIMSPKQQNTPRNDLTDVHGLKEMMATPRERKELQNELGDVEVGDNILNISGVQRLSIESDIENNEDLFDKLFAKKPLRTYRGKSSSPASRKATMFDDKRKTLGDAPYSSPRVEKWIEEQAVIKLNRLEDAQRDKVLEKTQGTAVKDTITDNQQETQKRRVRGRRTEKKAVGGTSTSEELIVSKDDEVSHDGVVRDKTNVQETLTDDVVNENKKESLKKAVGRSSPFVGEGSAVENKRKNNITIDDESNVKLVKKITRSRRKMDEDVGKEYSHEQLEKKLEARQIAIIVDGKQSKDVSNTNESECNQVNSTSELNFKLPQATRGRPRKISQKDQSGQIPEIHSTTEDTKSSSPKWGRGKRAREINQDGNVEVFVSSPRRGGRLRNTAQVEEHDEIESKNEELPQPKRLRGQRKSPVKKAEESGTDSDVKSFDTKVAQPKRGRGRKAKVVTDKEQTTDESDNTPVITKRTRGRKQNVVVASESDSNITASKETTQIVHQNEIEISEVEKDAETGKGKIRSNIKKIAEKETESENLKVTEPVRSIRGRKRPVAAKVEPQEDNVVATLESISDITPEETTQIVHQSKIESNISKVQTDNKTGKKVGRNMKKVIEQETESENQKMTESVRSTRARKQPTAVTAEAHDSEQGTTEVAKSTKWGTGETGYVKDDVDIVSSKHTRGRKRLGKTTSKCEESEKGDSETTEVDGMEAIFVKPTRGRKRLEKTTNKLEDSAKAQIDATGVDNVQVASPKPTRGKKRLGKMTNKVEGSEKGESESTDVDDTEITFAKPTRGRKRLEKTTNKLTENEEGETEVKNASSSSKKTSAEEEMKDVEDEKIIVRSTRGRKLKVDQAKLVEDSVPVDSPRTARAKRGNFNKYGNDFVTEHGKKEESKDKKHVRFEEDESTNNKRKGRNVKIDEVEEPIRKSKRTRK